MLAVPEQTLLLQLGRTVLENLEDGDPQHAYEEFLNLNHPLPTPLQAKLPCFVTLKTRTGRVRSSTGTTAAHAPLHANVYRMVEEAALRDPRTTPIAPSEAASLIVQISVLSPPAPLLDWAGINWKNSGIFLRAAGKQAILLNQLVQEQRLASKDRAQTYLVQSLGVPMTEAKAGEWFVFSEQTFQEPFASFKN